MEKRARPVTASGTLPSYRNRRLHLFAGSGRTDHLIEKTPTFLEEVNGESHMSMCILGTEVISVMLMVT